jgi:hypothetical protein
VLLLDVAFSGVLAFLQWISSATWIEFWNLQRRDILCAAFGHFQFLSLLLWTMARETIWDCIYTSCISNRIQTSFPIRQSLFQKAPKLRLPYLGIQSWAFVSFVSELYDMVFHVFRQQYSNMFFWYRGRQQLPYT